MRSRFLEYDALAIARSGIRTPQRAVKLNSLERAVDHGLEFVRVLHFAAFSQTLARIFGTEPGGLAMQFIGTPPEGTTEPIEVRLTFTRSVEGSDPLTFTDSMTLDPAALAVGVTYDSQITLFDTKDQFRNLLSCSPTRLF